MDTTTALLIVGAGPAGSSAAIEAARAGLETLVIDKATFPREKCCGDGLTASALRNLQALGLDPSTIPSWQPIDDVRLVSPTGRQVVLPLPRDRGRYAVVARRRELDHALVQLARQAGATVAEGVELTGIESATDDVTVTTSAGVITARAVIAADGMWSSTRRLLGHTPAGYRGEWHAFRQYFTNVAPDAGRELVVWFDAELLPGYVWSFPLADGAVNLGFGIQRGRDHSVQDMKQLWVDLLRRPYVRAVLGPDATPEGPHRAWPIPARLGGLALSHGRVLFVGDAAAATDPMTGEGIGQAIETGRYAGQRMAAFGVDDVASAAVDYERSLARGMVRDHRLAGALSAVLATRRGAAWSIAAAGATDWTRRQFGRWLFEDYPRALLSTPSRWSRGMLNQPGAYPG